MKKITGGAWIPQGVHEKKFRRASRAEIHAPPGQMSVSAPVYAYNFYLKLIVESWTKSVSHILKLTLPILRNSWPS